MDFSFCMDDECKSKVNETVENKQNAIDKLVQDWGYTDLLPENEPDFPEIPYAVHIATGSVLTLIGKILLVQKTFEHIFLFFRSVWFSGVCRHFYGTQT